MRAKSLFFKKNKKTMMKSKIRTSRISFIGNYFLGISLLFLIYIANLTLNPPTIIIYFLFIIAILLFLEPEGIVVYTSYKLDTDHISEIKGIFVKRQIAIPYRAVADQRLKKGIIGRILNYGDVIITGPKTQIKMRGIRGPERFYKEIEKKLANLMTPTNPSFL